MNKLTKQLLSLGLSVVTVAGMVSPVFADDDVNPVDDTTDVVEQETTNNTTESEQQKQDAVSGQSEESQTNISEDGTTSDNQTVMKTYNLKIVYQDENRVDNITFTVSENEDSEGIVSYVKMNFIPEGYECYGCYQTELDLDTWILEVGNYTQIEYKNCIDGILDNNVHCTDLPKAFTDDQIKEHLSKNNLEGGYDLKSIEKQEDGTWVINLVTPNPNNETFKLIINKDGQETTSTITVSKEEQKEYRDLSDYLIKNYLPDGYHIDRSYGKSIFSIGTNIWKMYIVKDNENPTLKTYKLKLILADEEGRGAYENAKVEYHTFEYDSSNTEGILDYMAKKFLPKGYYCQIGASGTSTVTNYTYVAYKVSSISEPKIYEVNYIDKETNNTLFKDTKYLRGSKKSVLTIDDLDLIPMGYVFIGDSFDIVETENSLFTVNIYMKKGEYKTPVTMKFYSDENGKLINIKTVKTIAQEVDKNNDGKLDFKEVRNYLPTGYDFDGIPILWDFYDFTDQCSATKNYDFIVNKTSSIITSEESKNIATIEDEDLKTILDKSLSTDQKEKVDAAIADGKTVEFVPVLKESVKAEDKKALETYAQKNDINVVNAFDVEIQLYIDNEQIGTIPETNKELTFKVVIPRGLKKENRKFYVLRLHDGKVDKIPVNEDGTFKTDKFSSYMLVYEDVSSSTKPTEGTKDDNKEESSKSETIQPSVTDTTDSHKEESKKTTNITSKSNKSTSSKKNVNTGLKTQSSLFAGLAAISMASIGIIEVLKRRK